VILPERLHHGLGQVRELASYADDSTRRSLWNSSRQRLTSSRARPLPAPQPALEVGVEDALDDLPHGAGHASNERVSTSRGMRPTRSPNPGEIGSSSNSSKSTPAAQRPRRPLRIHPRLQMGRWLDDYTPLVAYSEAVPGRHRESD
jgi:hypothetical protein